IRRPPPRGDGGNGTHRRLVPELPTSYPLPRRRAKLRGRRADSRRPFRPPVIFRLLLLRRMRLRIHEPDLGPPESPVARRGDVAGHRGDSELHEPGAEGTTGSVKTQGRPRAGWGVSAPRTVEAWKPAHGVEGRPVAVAKP